MRFIENYHNSYIGLPGILDRLIGGTNACGDRSSYNKARTAATRLITTSQYQSVALKSRSDRSVTLESIKRSVVVLLGRRIIFFHKKKTSINQRDGDDEIKKFEVGGLRISRITINM